MIATDRHVLQGALELESMRWDADTRTLEGVSLGPEGTAHNLTVYVPEAQPWKQGGPFLYHEFDGDSLKMVEPHLLRVRVRFERGPRVLWMVPFREFLANRA